MKTVAEKCKISIAKVSDTVNYFEEHKNLPILGKETFDEKWPNKELVNEWLCAIYRKDSELAPTQESLYEKFIKKFPDTRFKSKKYVISKLKKIHGVKCYKYRYKQASADIQSIRNKGFYLANMLLDIMNSGGYLLFLDGSGIYSSNFRTTSIGTKIMPPLRKKIKGTFRRNFLCMVDTNRIVAINCSKAGHKTQEIFFFVHQALIKLKREREKKDQGYWIFLDNCNSRLLGVSLGKKLPAFFI